MTKKDNEEYKVELTKLTASAPFAQGAPHGNSKSCLTAVMMEVGLEGMAEL